MRNSCIEKASSLERNRETVVVVGDDSPVSKTKKLWSNDFCERLMFNPSAFIGMEMSLVPEVEDVFIYREDNTGKLLRVLVVIDKSDEAVRSNIYERERAIMDELGTTDFNFHVLSREGRNLSEVVTDAGEHAYRR